MSYFKLFKQLWRYADKDRWKIIVFLVFHFISVLAVLFNPLVFAQILNTIQLSESEDLLNQLVPYFLIFFLIFIWFNIFHRLGRYLEFDVAYRVKQRFVMEKYSYLSKMPMDWHSYNHSGDSIDRINLAADSLLNFCTMHYRYIEYSIMFWGPLIALYFLSWPVSILAFFLSIITIIGIKKFDIHLIKAYKQINDINHNISAKLHDFVTNIKSIIILRLEKPTKEQLDQNIDKGHSPYMRAEGWINAIKWFFVMLCMLLSRVGLLFYYIWLEISNNNTLLVGNITAVYQYLDRLGNTFANIAKEYQQIIHWHTNFESSEKIFSDEREVFNSNKNEIKDWKKIRIENLSFAYSSEKQIFDNINFSFSKGEKIALVGDSGSGKSTLMSLLRGVYKAQNIHLYIDDALHDNHELLYQASTLIPQDPEIFENSIKFNIDFGLDTEKHLLNQVVEISQLEDFIEAYPEKMNTTIREKGSNLSGGQKQRLALARGLLAAEHSSIVLLDESTSSVDLKKEKKIYDAIFEIYKNKTIIASMHRLNLLKYFDKIIILENGKIIEQGSFQELNAKNGKLKYLLDHYNK